MNCHCDECQETTCGDCGKRYLMVKPETYAKLQSDNERMKIEVEQSMRVDDKGNQSLVAVVEDPAHGFVGELPALQVQFQDGCPDILPTIE